MTRSYSVMREVLALAAKARHPLDFECFERIDQRDKVVAELKRLFWRSVILTGNQTILLLTWSGRRDSNPHGRYAHVHLKHARLPFRHAPWCGIIRMPEKAQVKSQSKPPVNYFLKCFSLPDCTSSISV